MTHVLREESGTEFSLPINCACFPEDHYNILSNVSHIDFVVTNEKGVFYVEVKRTAPNMDNEESMETYIHNITRKFLCGLLLHSSVTLERNKNLCFPDLLIENTVLRRQVHFVLVITHEEFPKRLLEDVKLVLEQALKPYTNAYGKCRIAVWNPEMAERYGLK